jgi:recombination protein RecT
MTNAIEKPKENRLENLIKTDSIKRRFEEVLGKKASVFMSSVIAATKANSALGDCEPSSVLSAAMQAATLDLPINSSLGFCYIVPYSGVGQFQIGFKGLIQLAQRTGLYETMNAAIIHEGQLVSEDEFTGEYVFKKERISDKIIGYLFYFKLLNGYKKQVYWPIEKVEKHAKRYSKTYAKGIGRWKEDFDAMALKTVVIEGLKKWGPMSIEMQTVQKAIISDQAVIDVESGDVKDFPDSVKEEVTKAETTSSRLKQAIKVEPTQSEIEKKEQLLKQAASIKSEPVSEVVPEEVNVGDQEGLTKEKVSKIKSAMDRYSDPDELTEYFNGLPQEAKVHIEIKGYYASNWKILSNARKNKLEGK